MIGACLLPTAGLVTALMGIDCHLSAGRNVLLHCRQGIGRTGLVPSCLLVDKGWNPADAVKHLSPARGLAVPESKAQRHWIDEFALAISLNPEPFALGQNQTFVRFRQSSRD
jgi:hypothetical protein